MQEYQLHQNILYACNETKKRGKEQFVPNHSLSHLISGEIEFNTDAGTIKAKAGNIGFAKRNQLVKSLKIPGPNDEPCKSISIYLTQELLHRYSLENDIKADKVYKGPSLIALKNSFIKGYFDSLIPYFESPKQLTKSLIKLKTNEAIELLLQHDENLKNVLFDFSEPYKIDLEAYMNQHYKFNVPMKQFATLTGRSLATFKRDFQKVFNTTPQRWLLNKRLHEAHFLIAERKQKPSDAYVEVGFENLSHFSTSFKNLFGYNPSSIAANA